MLKGFEILTIIFINDFIEKWIYFTNLILIIEHIVSFNPRFQKVWKIVKNK